HELGEERDADEGEPAHLLPGLPVRAAIADDDRYARRDGREQHPDTADRRELIDQRAGGREPEWVRDMNGLEVRHRARHPSGREGERERGDGRTGDREPQGRPPAPGWEMTVRIHEEDRDEGREHGHDRPAVDPRGRYAEGERPAM